MSGHAIAVGVYDGLHRGHREILGRMIERARARGNRSMVVSFDPHPDVVLSPTFRPLPPLTPHAERRARLVAMGVDDIEVIPFTRELAALEPEAFVEQYLVQGFAMRDLVVGANFALGRKRAGDVPRLREIGRTLGYEVEAVPLLELDGEPVSSTRIRALLGTGDVAGAAALLGRHYSLSGVVVTGERIGRTLGFPTANLRMNEEKLLPADGVYAARTRIADESEWRPTAMSLGMRPTFDGETRAIEAYLLDWSGELVGVELEVEFHAWIREQQRFEGLDALEDAIRDDVSRIRTVLDAQKSPA